MEKGIIHTTQTTREEIEASQDCFIALEQPYEIDKDGHKYDVGDKLEVHGMEEFTEFNGKIVEVTAIREDWEWGKCYYVTGLEPTLNWVYEKRLRAIEETS